MWAGSHLWTIGPVKSAPVQMLLTSAYADGFSRDRDIGGPSLGGQVEFVRERLTVPLRRAA